MSIKDRIAAANARAESGDDDDELDDLIDEIDSAEFGAEDDEDVAEPTPAWEKDEADDELESDSEDDNPEVPEDGDPLDDELGGDEIADDAEPAVSTVDTPAPTVRDETPSLDTLRRFGYPTEVLSEAQATRKLAVEFESIVNHFNNNRQYIQLGQEFAPHADRLRPLVGGAGGTPPVHSQPDATPAPKAEKKVDLEALLAKVGTVEAEPEIRPEWKTYVAQRQIIFDGDYYVAAPNAPHLAAVADRLNDHRNWERRMQSRAFQLPDVVKEIAQTLIEQRSSGGLSMEQVEANFREKQAAAEDEKFAREIVNRNKGWMFETSSTGEILKHPIHGTPIITKEGLRYYRELEALHQAGMRDSRKMHYYALASLGKSLADEIPNRQTPRNDAAAPASSAAGSTTQNTAAQASNPAASAKSPADRRVELLQRQRRRASRSSNIVSGGAVHDESEAPARQARRPSLGAMLEDDFVKAGIKTRRRRNEEDDE